MSESLDQSLFKAIAEDSIRSQVDLLTSSYWPKRIHYRLESLLSRCINGYCTNSFKTRFTTHYSSLKFTYRSIGSAQTITYRLLPPSRILLGAGNTWLLQLNSDLIVDIIPRLLLPNVTSTCSRTINSKALNS